MGIPFFSRGFAGAELGALEARPAQGCWFGRGQAGLGSGAGLAPRCSVVVWPREMGWMSSAWSLGWCTPLSRVVCGLSRSCWRLGTRTDVLENVGEGLPQDSACGTGRAEQLMVKRCLLPLRILLKSSAGKKRSPRDRDVLTLRGGGGGHLSVQGPWESMVVAGTTVALHPCPETETVQGARRTLCFLPCALWGQTLAHCRGNLPLVRSGHKACMSGVVPGKAPANLPGAGGCAGPRESSGSLLGSPPAAPCVPRNIPGRAVPAPAPAGSHRCSPGSRGAASSPNA